uniref:Serpin B6 n=1 Tax=Callorhinchus milii TaxID=7868 RepID=A0A4W3K8C6_CALMI
MPSLRRGFTILTHCSSASPTPPCTGFRSEFCSPHSLPHHAARPYQPTSSANSNVFPSHRGYSSRFWSSASKPSMVLLPPYLCHLQPTCSFPLLNGLRPASRHPSRSPHYCHVGLLPLSSGTASCSPSTSTLPLPPSKAISIPSSSFDLPASPTCLPPSPIPNSTELAAVDFCNESDEIRQQINAWAEIKDLLAPNAIGSLTKLVLVNAIYFKGNWERKFEAESTHERPFKISKINCKIALAYIEDTIQTAHMYEFRQAQFSLLPFPSRLVIGISVVLFIIEVRACDVVIVMLPKFKMENTYGFTSTLGGMRMVDVFDVSKANFLGMTEKNDLNLSKVVHKTFADVNEEGTEAAAATAVTMRLMCLMITMEFVADHPFLFFISHNKTHNILFFGRFSSP